FGIAPPPLAVVRCQSGAVTCPRVPIETPPARARSLLVLSRFGVCRKRTEGASRWVVGRGEGCDVRIDDAKASRQHCAIVFGARAEVVDLGSTNGTLLGG